MSEPLRVAQTLALFVAVLAVAFTAAFWLGRSVGPVGPAEPAHDGAPHSMEVDR